MYEDGYGNMIPIAVTLFCCNVLSSCHIRKQYQNIYMVSGETDYQEKTVGSNYHIML